MTQYNMSIYIGWNVNKQIVHSNSLVMVIWSANYKSIDWLNDSINKFVSAGITSFLGIGNIGFWDVYSIEIIHLKFYIMFYCIHSSRVSVWVRQGAYPVGLPMHKAALLCSKAFLGSELFIEFLCFHDCNTPEINLLRNIRFYV